MTLSKHKLDAKQLESLMLAFKQQTTEHAKRTSIITRKDMATMYENAVIETAKKYGGYVPPKKTMNRFYRHMANLNAVKQDNLFDTVTYDEQVQPVLNKTDRKVSNCFSIVLGESKQAFTGLGNEYSHAMSLEEGDVFRSVIRSIAEQQHASHSAMYVEVCLLNSFFNLSKKEQALYVRDIWYGLNVFQFFSLSMNGKYAIALKEFLVNSPEKSLNEMDNWEEIIQDINNRYPRDQKIEKFKKDNLNSQVNCINLTIMGAPEFFSSRRSVMHFTLLGVTNVVLDVQHFHEKVLKLIDRQHNERTVSKALNNIANAGLRMGCIFTFDLPGATPDIDMSTLVETFGKQRLFFDYFMLNWSLFQDHEWYDRTFDPHVHHMMINPAFTYDDIKKHATEQNKSVKEMLVWKPYSERDENMYPMVSQKTIIHAAPWVRCMFIARYFKGHFSKSVARPRSARDINSRRIHNAFIFNIDQNLFISVRKINCQGATEFYISLEYPKTGKLEDVYAYNSYMIGFVRMRIGNDREFSEVALIRDLQMYGSFSGVSRANKIKRTEYMVFLINECMAIAQRYKCFELRTLIKSDRKYNALMSYLGFRMHEEETAHMYKNLPYQKSKMTMTTDRYVRQLHPKSFKLKVLAVVFVILAAFLILMQLSFL